MNRNTYALLTAVLLSLMLNLAQAETMEERKQRIMRKYMRERQDIAQSDFGVPEAEVEDARVLESEQFKEPSVEFQRQPSAATPPPAFRPVPVQQERNWWLETSEADGDLYSDPFASKSADADKSENSWSPWGKREDSSVYGGADNRQPGWRRDDTSPGSPSAYDIRRESGNGFSGSDMTDDGYTSRWAPGPQVNDRMSGYGRQQLDHRGRRESGWGRNSADRYGSSTTPGVLPSPYSSPYGMQGSSARDQAAGYTPYRNPYQSQGEDQRRRSGGSLQPQQPQYTRPDHSQTWKESYKSWDPTSDNPYLDELMPNQRW